MKAPHFHPRVIEGGQWVTHYGPSNFTRFGSIAVRLLQDLVLAVGLRAVGQAPPERRTKQKNMMCKNLSRHHKISRDLM